MSSIALIAATPRESSHRVPLAEVTGAGREPQRSAVAMCCYRDAPTATAPTASSPRSCVSVTSPGQSEAR